MRRNIFTILCIIACFFSLYFYSLSKANKSNNIYFFTGTFGKVFDENNNGFYNLYHDLKENDLTLKETRSFKHLKNIKQIIVFDIFEKKLRRIKRFPKEKLVLFLWEPACVIPQNYEKKYHKYFSKIYTLNDDLVDNEKYFKFYSPAFNEMRLDLPSFEDKKFCCLIAANKSSSHPTEIYSQRREAIEYFENYALKDFDLYGYGWDENINKSYKGSIKEGEKSSTMMNYKFSICYENSLNVKGYVTEKIFDCFTSGCVPVYLGADNIYDYIPKQCFIDKRDFNSYNELYVYLKTMTGEDHQIYLENIRDFLKSDTAKLFTVENFKNIFKESINL